MKLYSSFYDCGNIFDILMFYISESKEFEQLQFHYNMRQFQVGRF